VFARLDPLQDRLDDRTPADDRRHGNVLRHERLCALDDLFGLMLELGLVRKGDRERETGEPPAGQIGDADQRQAGTLAAGEVDRLLERFRGGGRAVESDENAAEHGCLLA
jgi:hypothetical protein